MQRSQNVMDTKNIVKEPNCSENLSISSCTDLIINFQIFKTRRHYQQAKSDFHTFFKVLKEKSSDGVMYKRVSGKLNQWIKEHKHLVNILLVLNMHGPTKRE